MKYFVLTFALSFVLFLFNFDNRSFKNIEITLTVPQLNSFEINEHIENEFNKHKEIDYVGSSLMSNTIVVRVEEESFSIDKLEKILYKWGCHINDYYFRKLYTSQE